MWNVFGFKHIFCYFVLKANWGCHGSELMAIPFINFAAVSECIKDDAIISQFKLTVTGPVFTIPLADSFLPIFKFRRRYK